MAAVTAPAASPLRFGANDLVYGPSAGGKLRSLAESAGGKTLTDIERPVGMDWWTHSRQQMELAVKEGNMIHFDLTHMTEVEAVLANQGQFAGKVTSLELRYIRDNWSRFSNSVVFYENGVKAGPPWLK